MAAPFAVIPADAIPFNVRDSAGINLMGISQPGVQALSPGICSCKEDLPFGKTVNIWIVYAMFSCVFARYYQDANGTWFPRAGDYLTNIDMCLQLYDRTKPFGSAGWALGIFPVFGETDSGPTSNGRFMHHSASRFMGQAPTIWNYMDCPQHLKVDVPDDDGSGKAYRLGTYITYHTGAEEPVHHTFMVKGAWKASA